MKNSTVCDFHFTASPSVRGRERFGLFIYTFNVRFCNRNLAKSPLCVSGRRVRCVLVLALACVLRPALIPLGQLTFDININ